MTALAQSPRLDDSRLSRSIRPPVRIVHLGVGAFHRAHQAWYTEHSVDADEWGIAAFTGRSPAIADALGPQDGLYTLIERGESSDRFEVVTSIVQVFRGDEVDAFVELMARPEVAIVTLTITESGYRANAHGLPDLTDPEVVADVAALRAAIESDRLSGIDVRTALGRLVLGLEARRRADSPPLAVVPCDNIPANGPLVRGALRGLAELVSPGLALWLDDGVSVVSTSVDRITPRTTDADRAAVLAATGWIDEAPVVCEPFSDWVMSGSFPAGRPAWDTAGARFVDDIEPWEARKLWMLNGAHTVLAALGALRGHITVSEAIGDPTCLEAVRALWAEAARGLEGIEVDDYSDQLLTRFRNPRIEHRLEQIALDAPTKVRLRIVPVAVRERAAGRSASACATAVAAWLMSESSSSKVGALGGVADIAAAISSIEPALGEDAEFCDSVHRAIQRLSVATPFLS